MNVQWIVRAHILSVVKEADDGISSACLKWFPDHPGHNMNVSALENNDFWNDPYSENELAINALENYFKSAAVVNPVNIVLTISSAVQQSIAGNYLP